MKTKARIFLLVQKINKWRYEHISEKQFMMILSLPTGFLAGLSAIIIKKLAHWIRDYFYNIATTDNNYDLLFFILPTIGIFLTILVCRYVIKRDVGHGIPGILYAIQKNKGAVKPYNTFASIITSSLTVGFGGSVGLEGPSVSTGSAIGSNIGQLLRLNQKNIVVLIGMGCAASLASIFQAPITGIIFAIEVFMIDISMASLVPIMVSSFVAILTSYFFLGRAFEYTITTSTAFIPSNSLFYVGLGIFVGLMSAYFMYVYFRVDKRFKRIKSPWMRFALGSAGLGILIFIFPALYGEGYEAINAALNADTSILFANTFLSIFQDNTWIILLLLLIIILFKAFATSFTFAAGGVGGTFAPALFIGSFSGMLFAMFFNTLGLGELNVTNFALVGMGGVIAGMLHAPLTGIFLIAEITNGYSLMVPLMIVTALSYAINRMFFKDSIYTKAVSEKGVKVSHNKDVSILNMMNINKLIETNFLTVHPEQTLRELLPIISSSTRNIFPVIDNEGNLKGHVLFDSIRKIIFEPSQYDTLIEDIMLFPDYLITTEDSAQEVVKKFERSGNYNIVVVDGKKYLGYISRAQMFTTYQATLKEISDD
ncbi:MAG: chloride channel protein [Bacteroidales bacterium]|nr:chloride channel protein [Lentimicrobiaceae bacterium]MBQ2852716.1 chloride channel protein [Bacteroidales bacterium]